MQKIINWLVVSSADPSKTSMTLKGILLQYVTLILAFLTVLHIPLTETQVYSLITDVTGFVGIALSGIGLIRKIYLTVKR